MNSNILPSNRAVLAATIDPDAYGAASHDSDWVSMSDFESIQAIVMVGTLGTNATVDAILQQAQDSSGTGVKAFTPAKAITQITQAGTDQSDTQAIINCRSDELDVANGFTHVRLRITVGTATSDAGGLILGHDARYQPATDLASVGEVIS